MTSTDPRQRPLEVLVVEDSYEQRAYYRELFDFYRPGQFMLIEAEMGMEGLARYRDRSPDCILLDYRLPDMDGLEFLSSISNGKNETSVPVIMLTSQGDERVAVEAMKMGAADYLTKQQVDADLLSLCIERAVRQKQEQRFRTMLESAPDAMVFVREEGSIWLVNAQTERLFGYDRSELLGKPIEMLLPERFRHTHQMHRERFTLDPHIRPMGASLELYGQHKSGYEFPVEVSLSPMETNGLRLISSAIRDITERKEAEMALRRSEARNRALLEAIPDAMVRLARDGTYIDVQVPKSYEVIADPEALIGKTPYDVLPPAVAADAIACVTRALEIGTLQEFEYEIEINGKMHVREARVVAYGDDEVISIQRDITQRKVAERALQKSETLLRTVVSNIPIILFALDEEGRFTLIEGKGLKGLRTEPGQAIGHEAAVVFADAPEILDDIERARLGHAFNSIVEVYDRAFECWYSPLVAEEGRAGVIGVAADITEVVNSQRELSRSREALRRLTSHLQSVREEERTRLSREVHDVLGQALTALRMDVMWLERSYPPEAEKDRDRLNAMKTQIDDTIQTVRRIASDLRPGILDDLGVAVAIEWQAHRFQERTEIQCAITVPADPIPMDRDRSTAIFRIFQEVLTNVARHAQATMVDILLYTQGDTLVLQVSDNGRGIRPEDLRQTKSLGLLGMRERVLPWGGEVKFEGEPGEGTTVTVQLPLAQ